MRISDWSSDVCSSDLTLALLLAAIAQDQRTGLSIGDPMRADGCARRKQFLDHDIAFERVAIAAAVARREGHSDIARRAERAAETGIETRPAICPGDDVRGRLVRREPWPQHGTQCRNVAGRIERIDRKSVV